MKKVLLNTLICPSCLPKEHPLIEKVDQEEQDDIIEGCLTCKQCGRDYPIRKGLAFLAPAEAGLEQSDNRYETASLLSSYLWSHYGDLLEDPEASTAYTDWADHMRHDSGFCLDIGSAVGRFSFEMTKKC
ncbi:MAG: SAM-dependent methyltransferase, partial [Deltaproteobacteria bacterium]|nr:SAM-dependent methyltransferase [Deltaproteobacteria bacterium]